MCHPKVNVCEFAIPISFGYVTLLFNYVIVRKRRYPFGFKNLEEFQEFGKKIKDLLKQINIDVSDVRVQGSSLRTKEFKDIDIAIFLKEDAFNALVNKISRRFDEANRRAGKKTKNAKAFERRLAKGQINSFDFDRFPDGRTFNKVMDDNFEIGLDISIIEQGSPMDMSPYLKF